MNFTIRCVDIAKNSKLALVLERVVYKTKLMQCALQVMGRSLAWQRDDVGSRFTG